MKTVELRLCLKEAIILLLSIVVVTLLVNGIFAGKYRQAMQLVQQQEQLLQQQQRGFVATNELLNKLYATGKWSPQDFSRLGYVFKKQENAQSIPFPEVPKESK